MEYMNDGDLFQKIQKQQREKQYFHEDYIWNVFIQVIQGLKALHDLNVLHRDLKSANVFISKSGLAKLGDFNVSKLSKQGLLYTQTGTPYYASPEVWKDQPYNNKSDIWSMGCVLYEIVTLKPPFRAEDMQSLYQKILKGQYQKIPTHYSQDLSNLIKQMLQVNFQNRPSCDKILASNAFLNRMQEKHLIVADEGENTKLIQTIIFPKQLKNYSQLKNYLPEANYSELKIIKKDKRDFIETISQIGYEKENQVAQNVYKTQQEKKKQPVNQNQQQLPQIINESNIQIDQQLNLIVQKKGNKPYNSYSPNDRLKQQKILNQQQKQEENGFRSPKSIKLPTLKLDILPEIQRYNYQKQNKKENKEENLQKKDQDQSEILSNSSYEDIKNNYQLKSKESKQKIQSTSQKRKQIEKVIKQEIKEEVKQKNEQSTQSLLKSIIHQEQQSNYIPQNMSLVQNSKINQSGINLEIRSNNHKKQQILLEKNSDQFKIKLNQKIFKQFSNSLENDLANENKKIILPSLKIQSIKANQLNKIEKIHSQSNKNINKENKQQRHSYLLKNQEQQNLSQLKERNKQNQAENSVNYSLNQSVDFPQD